MRDERCMLRGDGAACCAENRGDGVACATTAVHDISTNIQCRGPAVGRHWGVRACVRACACVCVCARVCVRVCVRECVCVDMIA